MRESALPRVLFVGHAWGGGVRRHMLDLAGFLRGRCEIVWLEPGPAGSTRCALAEDHAPGTVAYFDLPSQLDALVAMLRGVGIARLHYHHVHGLPRDVLDLPRALGVPYDFTLHDYFALCPSPQWPGSEEIVDAADDAGCRAALGETPVPWGLSVPAWRQLFAIVLLGADRVIAPSRDVANRYRRLWPALNVLVWPHPETPARAWDPVVRVVALGRLSPTKGLHVVSACAQDAQERGLPLWFRIVGCTTDTVLQFPDTPLSISGEYPDAMLPALLIAEKPDVLFLPNQVPESYGYTLSAALAADGVPIVASDLGAFPERLRNLARCRLVAPSASAAEWNRALLEAAGDRVRPDARVGALLGTRPAEYVAQYMARVHAPMAGAGAMVARLPDPDQAMLSPPGPPEPSPSLPTLYRAGVEWGQRESRVELERRLASAEAAEARTAEEMDRALRLPQVWDLAVQEALLDRDRAVEAERAAVQEAQRLGAALAHAQEAAAIAHAERNAALQDMQETGLALRETQSQLAATLEERERLQRETQQRAEQSEHALSLARERIFDLEHSTSWRITEPMRAISRRLQVLSARLHATRSTVRHVQRQTSLARSIWRDQGTSALARRVWAKLGRANRYQPPAPVTYQIEPATEPLAFPPFTPAHGTVSIIVPVYGQHKLTYNCLKSILEHSPAGRYEVIVVDDASPEPLADALPTLDGVRMERNPANLGFIGTCNRGAALARGAYLLFLNNDTIVTAGWLEAILGVFETHADAGLVGGKLVYPDGRLQEAGSIVWRDGSGWNCGRNGDPEAPEHNYVREVDYCSGACLAIPAALFDALGGLDTRYAPAYFEDTDLAFAVRAAGRKVYYQPRATIVHFEGQSSGTDLASGVKRHQVTNQRTFAQKWAAQLATHRSNGERPELEHDRGAVRRVLVIDACMLTPDQDSGSMRMQATLELLLELGCKVSFVADNLEHRQPYVGDLQQRGVEVLFHPYVQSIAALLATRGNEFDMIVLSRHYIAVKHVDAVRKFAPDALLVFDTVDLHFLRTERQAELEGGSFAEAAKAKRDEELALINAADVTLVVSPIEQALLSRLAPGADVALLSNIHELFAPGPAFAQREGLLFIGGFRHPPNIDAVLWYAREILPRVRMRVPGAVTYIIGAEPPASVRELAADDVVVTGYVPDVAPFFARCRLSISPLRYGAGVKGKINLAMCYGVPVVATSPSVEGMHLEPGESVLVGDTPEAFADAIARAYQDEALWQRLAEGGRQNIRDHFSREVAREALAELLARIPAARTGAARAAVEALSAV